MKAWVRLVTGVVAALALLRIRDARADRSEWAALRSLQPANPQRFAHSVVEELPAPARRYFTFAIAPDTPLLTVAELTMSGRFSLGTKASPNYQAMVARQILAVPSGFVWQMRTRTGLPISGSDAAGWTRFRIAGVIPVARRGGNADHARSAFGRSVAEAVFWTPAAMLPEPGIRWEAVDDSTARVTVTHGKLVQAVDVTVAGDGCPTRVVFQRWSDANPAKTYQLQPFGGLPSDFRQVQGFRVPFHVEAGNMFGSPDYFPFYIADLTGIQFPVARRRR
jgi:hypothetical protein